MRTNATGAVGLREEIRSAADRARTLRRHVREGVLLSLAVGGLVALTLCACRLPPPSGNDCMGPAIRAMAVITSPFLGTAGGLVAGMVVGIPLALLHTLGLRRRQRDEILAHVGALSPAQLAEIVGPLMRDPARDTRALARMVKDETRGASSVGVRI